MKEMKWYFIATGAIFIAMYISFAYAAHTKAQCRVAGFDAHRTVDEITKICGD